MSVYDDLGLICKLFEECNGDLERTKRLYKTAYGRNITDRHIIKAVTRKSTDPGGKEAQVEYIDCIQTNEEEEECEVKIIDCYQDPFAEDHKLTSTKIDPKLVYYPIVYTTRLEDMHIFNNNLKNIPLSSIVEQVEVESKPNLISDTLFQGQTFKNNSTGFIQLVNKIEQFNAAARTSAFQITNNTSHMVISNVKTEPEEFSFEINRLMDQSSNVNELDVERCRAAGGRSGADSNSEFESENSKEAQPAALKTKVEKSLDDVLLDKLYKLKSSDTLSHCNENDIKIITSKGAERENVLISNKDDDLSDLLKDKVRKLCKPLFVKLVDCKYPLKVKNRKNLFTTTKKGLIRIAPKATTSFLADDFKFVRASKIGDNKKNIWVVIKNLYSNTTEIYNMRHEYGIPVIYCRVGHIITEDRELALYIPLTVTLLEFSNCCWLKRYENTKKTFYCTGTSNIWTQPHLCPQGICICCCKDKISVNISDKSLNTSFISVKSKLINEGNPSYIPVTAAGNPNNIINKALVYQRFPEPIIIKAVDKKPYSFFNIRVQNKLDKSTHYFIVRFDGQIQTYLKYSKKPSYIVTKELTSSNDITNYFSTIVCCWVTFHNFLTNIMMNAVPVSYNFLVAPHACPPGNCQCCCKLLYTYRKFSFKPLVLPKTLSHTKRSNTKHRANLQILHTIKNNHNEICTSKQCLAERGTTEKATNSQVHSYHPSHTRSPVPVVPVALLQTTESKLNQPTLPVPQAEDPTVSTLISTILDRFKNIRLTLNPNGKVTAELDTPVSDLTTGELKILSNILSHAQNQVNTLGITNFGNTSISYPINSAYGYSDVSIPGPSQPLVADASTSTPQVHAIPKLPTIVIDGRDESEQAKKQIQKAVYKNLPSTDLYDTYSKLIYYKNKQYKKSLQSFTKVQEKSSLPQIQSTFSINQVNKPIDNANAIQVGKGRKRKQNINSDSNQETESPLAKSSKTVADIKIVNVQSVTDPNIRPTAPPPPFVAQPRGVPPLVPMNFPYTGGPILVINNPTDIQRILPNMPPQMLPPGTIIQPVVLPSNYPVPMPVPAVAPNVNNPPPLNLPTGKPEEEPILVEDDASEDCILGF